MATFDWHDISETNQWIALAEQLARLRKLSTNTGASVQVRLQARLKAEKLQRLLEAMEPLEEVPGNTEEHRTD